MKKRLRYDRIFICIGLILLIGLVIYLMFQKEPQEREVLMPNFVSKHVQDVENFVKNNNIKLEKEYEYSDDIKKDHIISQSIDVDKVINEKDALKITVSLGKIDKDKLADDNINELGRIPVMMYHGIVNKKNSDTAYTGGNVDKDGYNRTSEAFRNDLEFYYENGYRMIRAIDYVNGIIDVEYGKSPIVLTFDDGNVNNIKVTGLDNDGNIIIDENSAVGILESFKKRHPDFNVTATFFVNDGLFQQSEYNEQILKWMVDNGYDIGNHTKTHVNFSNATTSQSEEEVGFIYNRLENIIPSKYVNLVALPFGSPYKKTHENFSHILKSTYNGVTYNTVSTFRVGWMPDYSPYSTDFDKEFIMRVRAYDNDGVDFDIEASFRILEKNRYISDGNKDMVVIKESDREKLSDTDLTILSY